MKKMEEAAIAARGTHPSDEYFRAACNCMRTLLAMVGLAPDLACTPSSWCDGRAWCAGSHRPSGPTGDPGDFFDFSDYHFQERSVHARSRRMRMSTAQGRPNALLIAPARPRLALQCSADRLPRALRRASPCAVSATYFAYGATSAAAHAACD